MGFSSVEARQDISHACAASRQEPPSQGLHADKCIFKAPHLNFHNRVRPGASDDLRTWSQKLNDDCNYLEVHPKYTTEVLDSRHHLMPWRAALLRVEASESLSKVV